MILFSVSFNPAPIYVDLSVVHGGTPSFTVCGPHGGTGRLCAALWSTPRTCGLDIELHEIHSKARLSLCAQIWPGSNNQTAVQGLRLEQIRGIVE